MGTPVEVPACALKLFLRLTEPLPCGSLSGEADVIERISPDLSPDLPHGGDWRVLVRRKEFIQARYERLHDSLVASQPVREVLARGHGPDPRNVVTSSNGLVRAVLPQNPETAHFRRNAGSMTIPRPGTGVDVVNDAEQGPLCIYHLVVWVHNQSYDWGWRGHPLTLGWHWAGLYIGARERVSLPTAFCGDDDAWP